MSTLDHTRPLDSLSGSVFSAFSASSPPTSTLFRVENLAISLLCLVNTMHKLHVTLDICGSLVTRCIFKSVFIFMYMSVLPVCVFVHCLCAWSPRRPEEGIGSAESQMVGNDYVDAEN